MTATTAVAVNGAAGAGVHGALPWDGGREIHSFMDRGAVGYAHAFGTTGIALSVARGAAGDLVTNPSI